MLESDDRLNLSFVQKLFLKYYCHPPPGIPSDDSEVDTDHENSGSLSIFKDSFGPSFLESIQNKIVVDIGCGAGNEVVGLAKEGARKAVGLDYRPVFEDLETRIANSPIADKVEFAMTPLSELKEQSIDIVISQDSFEHFSEADVILRDIYRVLKKDGIFYVTFSPPWFNPYGVHMFFMIKYPWAHILFSEKTILAVRQLYRDDKPERYEDVDGGLNKMTIRKFRKMIKASGLSIDRFINTPIRKTPGVLASVPLVNEFFTSRVSAVLVRR